jgi:hypothetical protein
VQSYYPAWLGNLTRSDLEPQESRTSLGHIGWLKRSGRIVLRVTPKNGDRAPALLREAGLPARYAVGYSVQEKTGKGFIVRDRHAHAWCLVHLDGVWQDFDTTPRFLA